MVSVFNFAGTRAAIAISRVTVIAFLIGSETVRWLGITVTADDFLTNTAFGVAFVIEIDLTVGTSGGISAITFFAKLDDTVAADTLNAWGSRLIAAVTFFAFASGGAAIAIRVVAVVAFFVTSEDSVATGFCNARGAGIWTDPSGFESACF